MRLLAVFFSILLLSGCDSSNKQSSLPGYSGSFGEVVIVVSNANWNGLTGDALRDVYTEAQYGLPQDEPYFDVINVQKANFTSVFETFRNIVVVNIDPEWREPNYQLKKNEWAKDQVVVQLNAANTKELISVLRNNKTNLQDIFNNKELDRLIKRNKKFGKQGAVKRLKENMGLTMILQKDAELAEVDSTYAWIRIERERPKGGFMHQISQGILISTYDYNAREQFSDSALLAQRDELLKQYVKGTHPDAYLTTDYKYVPPQTRAIDYRGNYAKEVRGLWKMTVEYMGGPMYSLAFLDESNNRIILASGYVFSPEFDKREFIRETEAMIKSIRIKGKK